MWRFAQITDPHLASSRNGVWNNGFLCSMMPEVMSCLRDDLAALRPDFLLATGDIVSHHGRKSIFAARDAMDTLGVPYYPMGGNHDFYSMESRAWFLEAYAHRLPAANTVYSFVHNNLRFCVLDPWWVWRDGALMPVPEPDVAKSQEYTLRETRWALPPEQFVWLESVLEAYTELPVILAMHYPPLPVPIRLRHPNYKDAGSLENGALLMKAVSKYPHVKAVFAGHVHTNSICREHGIYQITTSSLPEYPVEFREVQVFKDRLKIITHSLSDRSFAERSRLEGHEYTAGEKEDREVEIPLT